MKILDLTGTRTPTLRSLYRLGYSALKLGWYSGETVHRRNGRDAELRSELADRGRGQMACDCAAERSRWHSDSTAYTNGRVAATLPNHHRKAYLHATSARPSVRPSVGRIQSAVPVPAPGCIRKQALLIPASPFHYNMLFCVKQLEYTAGVQVGATCLHNSGR
jgi:hypothetical protein